MHVSPGSLVTPQYALPDEEDPSQETDGVAPQGWEQTITHMKRSGKIRHPWALAWWMQRRHYTPHRGGQDALFDATAQVAQQLMQIELLAMAGPAMPGALIRQTATHLLQCGAKGSKRAWLYAEKPQGFQCRTCAYAAAANGTHGFCAIVEGSIALDTGCCAGWTADLEQLQVHKEY